MANQDVFEMGNGVIVSVVSFKYSKATRLKNWLDWKNKK